MNQPLEIEPIDGVPVAFVTQVSFVGDAYAVRVDGVVYRSTLDHFGTADGPRTFCQIDHSTWKRVPKSRIPKGLRPCPACGRLTTGEREVWNQAPEGVYYHLRCWYNLHPEDV